MVWRCLMLKIKEYVRVKKDDSHIYIYHRKGVKIQRDEKSISIITCLISGCSETDLYASYGELARDIVKLLKSYDFLRDGEIAAENPLEDRFFYYLEQYSQTPQELYKQLNQAYVCIVGVGGIGGNILQILATSGVKRYLLIDYDKVEYSNLNRQFFYTVEDVGKDKVSTCKDKLMKIDSRISCKTYEARVTNKEQLLNLIQEENIDVLVASADYPLGIRDVLRDVAIAKECAFVSGGVDIDYGKYKFETPEQVTTKIRRGSFLEDLCSMNTQVTRGSFGATNAIISSFMAFDIVNYLLDKDTWSNGKTVAWDFKEMKFLEID